MEEKGFTRADVSKIADKAIEELQQAKEDLLKSAREILQLTGKIETLQDMLLKLV